MDMYFISTGNCSVFSYSPTDLKCAKTRVITAIRKLCEELIQQKAEEMQEISFIAFKRFGKCTDY